MTTTRGRTRFIDPQLTAEEAEMARSARRCLMASLDHSRAAAITVEADDGTSAPTIQLPPKALGLIAQILGALGERRPCTVIPAKQELTTVEAAQFLNVSRPFVIKEIDEGRLAHRMVGTHRRIPFEALVEYEAAVRKTREEALQAMADEQREMGLEY